MKKRSSLLTTPLTKSFFRATPVWEHTKISFFFKVPDIMPAFHYKKNGMFNPTRGAKLRSMG
jgi:hypothetical protein